MLFIVVCNYCNCYRSLVQELHSFVVNDITKPLSMSRFGDSLRYLGANRGSNKLVLLDWRYCKCHVE
jgi:hypothetical protein